MGLISPEMLLEIHRDKAERPKGKWIYNGSYFDEGMLYCSKCKNEIDVSEGYFKYCPHCGAEMEGVAKIATTTEEVEE